MKKVLPFDPHLPSDVQFHALQQAAKSCALEHPGLIDLSMINSDLVPSRYCIDKLAEATIQPKNHHYAVARGIRRLRDSFAQRYLSQFSVVLDSEKEICVTQGAKDAIIQTLHVLAQTGKRRIVLPTPFYPAHRASSLIAGFAVELVFMGEDESENVKKLEAAFGQGDVAACLMSFPSNPQGWTVSKRFWTNLGSAAAKHAVTLINDFVYGELSFDGNACSALTAKESGACVVETYSLSKAFSLAGWRVGALVGDEEIVNAVAQRKSFTGFGIFLPLQIAAAAVLTAQQDLVSETREIYEKRTRFLSSGLKALGWEVQSPKAGICVWAKPPSASGSSYEVAGAILNSARVFVTPGGYFGCNDAYVRFACVQPQTKLQIILDTLRTKNL